MYAPTANNKFEIGSHVFTVEIHTYLYHLVDALPDYSLPHLEGKAKNFDKMKLEEIEVELRKVDNSVKLYERVPFPEVFGQVLDFYLEDTQPVFFPSYEYHILSPNGVVLRHVLLQTNRQDRMYTILIPALMMNKELADIKRISWRTNNGQTVYSADFSEIQPPPVASLQQHSSPLTVRGSDVHSSRRTQQTRTDVLSANRHFPTGVGFGLWSADKSSLVLRTDHSVDLRPLNSGIMNQGDLGTCGVSAITSFLEFISGERLSVLFLYWTSRICVRKELPHDDSGVELVDVLKALAAYGICRSETWPYEVCRFMEQPAQRSFDEAHRWRPSQFKLLKSMQEFKATLQLERPIFVDVFFSPLSYARHTSITGQVPKPPEHAWDESCEHTCLIMGYDDQKEHFIFQNTWGTSWGAGGFGFLPYDYIARGLFRNAYTWEGELPHEPFGEDENLSRTGSGSSISVEHIKA